MKDLKTGIIILALLAVTTMLGALLGWHLRSPAGLSEEAIKLPAPDTNKLVSPVDVSKP